MSVLYHISYDEVKLKYRKDHMCLSPLRPLFCVTRININLNELLLNFFRSFVGVAFTKNHVLIQLFVSDAYLETRGEVGTFVCWIIENHDSDVIVEHIVVSFVLMSVLY